MCQPTCSWQSPFTCQAEGELSLQPTRSPSTREAEVLVSSATAHPPFWTPAEEAAPGGSLSPAQPGPWQGWRFYICCFASGGGFPEERGGDGCFIRSALVEGILMTQFILWQGSEVWTCPKIKRKLGCVGIEVQSNTYTSLLLGQPVAQT